MTKKLARAMLGTGTDQDTAAPPTAIGRPKIRRQRPEYQSPRSWRALIRASRLAATSASRECGIGPATMVFRLAAARGCSAVQALVAGARSHRDRAAVRACRRVGVDERDLLDSTPGRGGDNRHSCGTRLAGEAWLHHCGRLAVDDACLVLIFDGEEVARHPPEDVID